MTAQLTEADVAHYFEHGYVVVRNVLSAEKLAELRRQTEAVIADAGKGRHVHTSLILHHQMEHLVPGAFALMANFIAKRE